MAAWAYRRKAWPADGRLYGAIVESPLDIERHVGPIANRDGVTLPLHDAAWAY